VAMLPTYAQHGIRMITVGLQGGCPSTNPPCPGGDHDWIVSAFTADGSLKAAWMNRLDQVITAADHNGIVVMVQFFYHGQNQRVTNQPAAVNNITDWLDSRGYTNVLVETANECDAGYSPYLDGGNCANEVNVIKQVQDRSGGKLKASVSWKGGEQPSDEVIKQEDFILLHGNGINGSQLQALITSTRNSSAYKANPKPIVVNEDSTSIANLDASVAAGVSWGYLDTGTNNYVDGFQRPPVNWSINTDAKKAFFGETLKLAGPPVTSLNYTGPGTADFNDETTLSGTLTDTWGNPLAARSLTFQLGLQSCSATTSAAGDAACLLTPNAAPGNSSLSIGFTGNDEFQGATLTSSFTIAHEQTALAYRGDAALINGVAAHLSAVLTEDGTTPLGGRAVTFTLGSGEGAQACSATTDANGLAICSPGSTHQPLGGGSVTASFGGDRFYAASTAGADVEVSAVKSGLTYTGPTSGDFNDPVTLTASLSAGDATVSGVVIAFTAGSQSCSGQTDAQGVAKCSITPAAAAGSYPLSASFAGTDNFQPSSAAATFIVTREETKLAYTGATALVNGSAAQLAATLTEDGSVPLAGQSVSFTVGSGASSQGCTATTDASGSAACAVASVNQPSGPGTIYAAFAGDAREKAATDSAASQVSADPSSTTTSSTSTAILATTGHPIVSLPLAGRVGEGVGAVLVLLGLLLLLLPRRRSGEPPHIIWRNRE
jgi:Bacterial Ig-like domain (group 3)